MSDSLTHAHTEQGLALLEALGFKPEDRVVSLKLTLNAKGLAVVEVERYVTAEQGAALATVVERYRLVPKDD